MAFTTITAVDMFRLKNIETDVNIDIPTKDICGVDNVDVVVETGNAYKLTKTFSLNGLNYLEIPVLQKYLQYDSGKIYITNGAILNSDLEYYKSRYENLKSENIILKNNCDTKDNMIIAIYDNFEAFNTAYDNALVAKENTIMGFLEGFVSEVYDSNEYSYTEATYELLRSNAVSQAIARQAIDYGLSCFIKTNKFDNTIVKAVVVKDSTDYDLNNVVV